MAPINAADLEEQLKRSHNYYNKKQQKNKEWFLPAAHDLTHGAAKVGKFSFLISIITLQSSYIKILLFSFCLQVISSII